jgi:Fe-S cluster assembly protein SufD
VSDQRRGSVLESVFLAEYERASAASGGPSWLRDLRASAMARFGALGFPTTRDEDWRFTSVAPIAQGEFRLAEDGAAGVRRADVARLLYGSAPNLAVVVNGRFVPELSRLESLPAGARVIGLAQATAESPERVRSYLARAARFDDRAFAALNTAFLHDGLFVDVPAHVVVDEPVHLLFLSSRVAGSPAQMAHARVLVVAGDDSQVRLVESYAGPDGQEYFTNAVTEVFVGANAVVDHYKVQNESYRAFHVASMHVQAERRGVFSSHSISLGGRLVRNDVVAVLGGEGIDCTLNGLYLADEQRLVDNHTTIDHAKPHCGSHEVYKGILGGRARAVFNGKIVVRQDAQKTDAKQTNRALLLSDDAQINTKPQLEIFADDVKCTHGAAVGQLDDDALFYLRARGLTFIEARDMLIHAFAGEILNRIRIAPLKEDLETELFAQLEKDLPEARTV